MTHAAGRGRWSGSKSRTTVSSDRHEYSSKTPMTCIEDQTSVLSAGDEHVVALAPQVPIGHIAHPTARAPTESVR